MSPATRADGGGAAALSTRAVARAGRLGPTVALHIYDVSGDDVVQQVNDVFRPLRTGMFHAGVEVLGKEFSFGYTASGSGVTVCMPRGNPQHKYRESVDKGRTSLTVEQVAIVLDRLQREWQGRQYDLLTRNCCHFSDALCRELGVGPAPEWVTSMAGAGAMLRSGVTQAVTTAHAAAGMAAKRASELDAQYQISSAVDGFSTQEVAVDEEYVRRRAKDLWAQASTQLGNIGTLAEKAINDAQKPIPLDVERVESAALSWWAWATGGSQQAAGAERTPASVDGPRTAPCPPTRPLPAAAWAAGAAQEASAPSRASPRPPPPPAGDELPVKAVTSPLRSRAGGRGRGAEAAAPVARVAPAVQPERTQAERTQAERLRLQAERPRTPTEEARRQAEFASSALDFGDVKTAKKCLREGMAFLEPTAASPSAPAMKAAAAADVPNKTKVTARKRAESAASSLDGGDKTAALAYMKEALELLEGQ